MAWVVHYIGVRNGGNHDAFYQSSDVCWNHGQDHSHRSPSDSVGKGKTMAKETYKVANTRIFNELGLNGWKLSTPTLKVRHATSPCGRVRLWFKPQAIHYSVGDRHDFGMARSLWVDSRGLPTSVLIADVENNCK